MNIFITIITGSCPPASGEICLIIDTSDSINDRTLNEMFTKLGEYAEELDIGTGCDQVQVAVVTFGRNAESPIGFNDYNDSASLAAAIKGLSRVAEPHGTKTHKALNKCLKMFSNDSCNSDDLIMLVTDGTSGEVEKLNEALAKVKAANINTITIGVTTEITNQGKLDDIEQQLLLIAFNKTENTYTVNSTAALDNLPGFLANRIMVLVQHCRKCSHTSACHMSISHYMHTNVHVMVVYSTINPASSCVAYEPCPLYTFASIFLFSVDNIAEADIASNHRLRPGMYKCAVCDTTNGQCICPPGYCRADCSGV